MKNKLLTTPIILMLLISTIPLILNAKPVEASITGPSLIVDDTVNQIHATLGATAGSAVTVKGTVTNLAYPGPSPLLTGVFYRENVGPGITPPDLTILWSLDGITWWPAAPIWCPTAYPGYQLELIIGGGGYWLPPGASSIVYIKTIANRPLGPTDVEAVVFVDSIANSKYDLGEPILTIPPPAYDFPVKIDLSIWNTAELDPAIFFSTIQAAIDAATPGQTIYVYDGTYKENLVVNKALTILAASSPVIDGGAAGNCISISANNVVISGFEIRNGYNGISGQTSGSTFSNNIIHDNLNIPGSAGVGILLWGDNDNNIITGNTIYDNDRQGIFIGYYDTTYISTGNTISYNTIYNNGLYRYANGPDASEYGVQLWTADNNVIEYNEIYDHDDWFPWGGTFDFAQGIYLCDSDSNFVTHNYLHNNNYGVGLWHPSHPVVTNNINYNNIAGNTGYGVCTFDGPPAVDARFNWWGDVSGPTHSSNTEGTGDSISDNVDYSPWLGATFATTPRIYHVNPTGGSDAIQEAIDEASDGDTIVAHAGTYYESQIIVDKSLRVLGSGADTTVIDGGNVALPEVGLVRITANTGDVTFNDFTIKNAGPAGAVRVGIYAASDTAGLTYTISNNKIYGTNTDDPDDYGFYSNGGKERLIFTNNLITQTGANPILFELHTGETEVSYNILDEGFYGSTVYFSMTYGGVNITTPQKVHHNTINVGTGFHTGSDYWGGGIAFNSASRYGTGNGTYTNVQITDNVINTMKGYRRGISLRNDASGDGSGGEISSPIIARNTITGIVGETENIGIWLTGLVTDATVSNNNITCTYLGVFIENATGAQICNNRIIDFMRGGIITRGAKNIFIEGNTISTTLHDEAPNGIDIGTYTGTSGTVKGNEISGCSWNGFGGDYETSWSASGILVIESADSLEIIGNTVYDCDVGMDIESDSMNITCSDVHNNIYGFVFWNANPKVNYNNIYSNTKYGVYRTTSGNLTGALDARYDWWSDATGPHHPTLNPSGLGNDVSDYVTFAPWLLQEKIPPLVHDIAVISVVPNATAVCAGDIVRIEVTVKNQGNTYETFSVAAYYDSIPINTQTVTDLIPGTNVILTFDWNTAGISPGEYTIKANASIVPGEIDILDNQLTDGIVKILCHNIAVTAVETFKTACGYTCHPFNIVYENYSVSINATVENQGDFPETFDVTAKYDDHIIGTIEVTLAAHTSTYVTFTWDTHGVARGSYNIAVEAVLPTDADPGDNTKTYGPVKVTWLGDSDGDFDVDEDDLWDFCAYFITYYTPGRGYMARSILFDFDENCEINEDDLWTFCVAFNNYYKWT